MPKGFAVQAAPGARCTGLKAGGQAAGMPPDLPRAGGGGPRNGPEGAPGDTVVGAVKVLGPAGSFTPTDGGTEQVAEQVDARSLENTVVVIETQCETGAL